MTTTTIRRKRLNLRVKRDFQKWLLIRMAVPVLLSSLLAAVILYFYARSEITDSFYTAHVAVRRVSDLLLPVIAAGSAVSLVSACIIALFLPQKIAGPLYRMEKRMQDLQAGDLAGLIRLRSKDILQDFAASINETTNVLRNDLQEIKNIHEEIERKTRHCEGVEEICMRQRNQLQKFRT